MKPPVYSNTPDLQWYGRICSDYCMLVCRTHLLELSNSCLFHKDRIGLLAQELTKGPMSTPSLLGNKWISIIFRIFTIIMCFSNLVVISPKLCPAPSTERSISYKATCTIRAKHECPTYTSDQLVHIGTQLNMTTGIVKYPLKP